MTAAFDQRGVWLTGSWDYMFQRAVDHFDCRMYASNGTSKGREGKRRAKRQSQIHDMMDKFRQVMVGPIPPQTKQQAVEAVAPILAVILSMLFKQFAIEVIEWLWDQLESQDSER